MIIFEADHPLVVNGTYDREGYKPGERARIAKVRARQHRIEATRMAKRSKNTHRSVKAGSRAAENADRAGRTATKRGRPRAQELPGMEDRAIKPLEEMVSLYAEKRDERMELTREEHDLKGQVLKLMRKYDKTVYRRDGIEVRIVPGEDDVKVKMHAAGEQPPDDDDREGDDTDDAENDAANGDDDAQDSPDDSARADG